MRGYQKSRAHGHHASPPVTLRKAQRPNIQDCYIVIYSAEILQASDALSYMVSKSHLKIRKDQRVDGKLMVCNAMQNTNYKPYILIAQNNAV